MLTTWVDERGYTAHISEVLNEKWFNIRQAKTPTILKKAMFDLAFYLKLTKATKPEDLQPLEWGNTLLWCMNKVDNPSALLNQHNIKPIWQKAD